MVHAGALVLLGLVLVLRAGPIARFNNRLRPRVVQRLFDDELNNIMVGVFLIALGIVGLLTGGIK